MNLSVLVVLVCAAVATVKGGPSDEENSTGTACVCPVICTQAVNDSSVAIGHDLFHYHSTTADCVALDSGCSTECVFNSLEECQSNCVEEKDGGHVPGCEETQFGCCSDKLTVRNKDGSCPGGSEINSVVPDSSHDKKVISPNHVKKEGGGGVRWDLVGVGVGVMVVLIVVLVLSGIVTYTYRNTHKDKQRSRYIHQVLQMYEDGSDSSCASDFSIDDDPENNNLFERL